MPHTFGFVVLNYLNFRETIDCVESILVLAGDHRIVVVDNLSPNESFEVLEARFRDDARVSVRQAGRNGGYSSGNNVGIHELRAQGIDDILIATSDTRIETPDLLERCAAARADGVAVVGPYVRGDTPGSQNPMLPRLTLRYIAAIHLGDTWTWLKGLAFRTVLRHRTPGPHPTPDGSITAPVDVYMVHGCFMYLSAHYFRHFPQLDEDLFMYGEEDLISFNCIRRGLRIRYDPLMRVYHGDGKSTSAGDFRRRAVSVSMAQLRHKMGIGQLVQAYVRSR
jgi:GT2 family glycosyltransferase